MKGYYSQDNSPAHKSLDSIADVCDCDFELVVRSPYSSDLTIIYSSTWKKIFGWNQYRYEDDIISAVDDFFDQQDEQCFEQ